MEKKPTSTYTGINKQVLKSLNRPYVAEPIKDENRVNELMSIFIVGEIDKINSILESNTILNFKDSTGQTLIHSILKNDSIKITEQDKLDVIKKLVEKNVSVNSMNQYNQNVLHLACQKGYVEIIEYLLTNHCEQNLVDNYGNAPLHYLIDKFIVECKQDDFYKNSNHSIQSLNSGEIKKIRDIMKLQSLISLFEIFGGIVDKTGNKYEAIGDSEIIIDSLKNFVKNKTQYELPTIYETIDGKISEINKLFLDPTENTDNKFEKAKNIILNSSNDIKKIYDYNLDITQSMSISDIIQNQLSQIDSDKKKLIKNIKENFQNVHNNIERVSIELNTDSESILNQSYCEIETYISEIYFVLKFTIENYNNNVFLDSTGNPIPKIFVFVDSSGNVIEFKNNNIPILLDNGGDTTKQNNVIMELLKINRILKDNFFIQYDPNSIPNSKFNIFINGVEEDNGISDIDLVYTSDINIDSDLESSKLNYIPFYEGFHRNSSGNIFYVYAIPSYIKKTKKSFENKIDRYINGPTEKKEINDNYFWMESNLYSKYSPIKIIITYIEKLIEQINGVLRSFLGLDENKFREQTQKFNLFYVKYLAVIFTKIINNLVILEKYLDDIDTKELTNAHDGFKEIFNNLSNNNIVEEDFITILNALLSSTIYKNEGKHLFDADGKFLKYFNDKVYREKISSIYNKLVESIDKIQSVCDEINKYHSVYQLEKYIEHINKYTKSGLSAITPVNLSNTLFNRYNYAFGKNFPKKYQDYKIQYFKIKEQINLYELGLEDLDSGSKYFVLDNGTQTKFIKPEYFIEDKDYFKKFYQEIIPYSNTFNFNTFYLDTSTNSGGGYNFYEEYDSIGTKTFIVNSTGLPIRQFEKIDKVFTPEGLEFTSGVYKFSRGYNCVEQTELEYRLGILSNKEPIDMLCDMKWIEPKSDYDVSTKSVKQNITGKSTFNIERYLDINGINFKSYIVTANFNELVGLLTYLIYFKILEKPDITKCFFQENVNIEFTDVSNPTNKQTKKLGIDLSGYGLDDANKKNITDTLSFISVNEKEKKAYLLENIKYFVKILVDQEIYNESVGIINNIKLRYPKTDTMGNIIPEQTDIITSKIQIDDTNKLLQTIKHKYKKDVNKFVVEIIKNGSSSNTLELVQITKTLDKDTGYETKTNEKIIGTKCLNKNKTNELTKIRFDYKILDLNGNTVLTRLIDQFNYYGIEKIVETLPLLVTYKNDRRETPINYLEKMMGIIRAEYVELNYNQRIGKYSMALENSLRDENNNFSEIKLEGTYELVKQILTNSIYLFNEVLWLKLYDYPKGWGVSDKKELMDGLGIVGEKLLINSFGDTPEDIKIYIGEEKTNIKTKIESYTKTLNDEITELENRKQELEKMKSNISSNSLVNNITDIDDNLGKIDLMIKDKNDTKKQYENLISKLDEREESYSDKDVVNIFSKYKDNLFDLKNTSIKWDNYNNLVSDLDSDYLRILKVLNLKPQKKSLISNFILKIFETNIVENNKSIQVYKKYFELIYDNLFADYWDLDKYENSNYNGLNKSIIEILKINTIDIIRVELVNMITSYITQNINIHIYNSGPTELSDRINKIKSNEKLLSSIEIYLYQCMITKLNIKDPNKTNYPDIDTEKNVIIKQIESIIGLSLNETDKMRIDKIIEFSRYISDNIGLNCYDEIKKILFDGKKMSIYYKILFILEKYSSK